MALRRPPLGAGFTAPQVFPDGNVDLTMIAQVARRAEQLGYDSLWATEQIIGDAVSLEPLSLLAYLAAITARVRLGVSVVVLPLRNPVHLAKTVATLDCLSQGRAILGVGLGGSDAHDAAFGLAGERRVARFVESLHVLDALWTQDAAHFDGDFYRLHGAAMRPKPIQQPRPPLWFGARSETALRRAVRYGDGWMGAGSSSETEFSHQAALIRHFLDDAGRDPATFTISKRVYLAIDDHRERAATRLRAWFAHTYGSADMANRVAIWGSQADVTARIEGLVEAGAQHILLNPVFDYDDHLDALQGFTGGEIPG